MLKIKMTLPEDIIKISEEFKKANFDLYVVGGSVRDFLQGKNPHDFDLVTNALPNETKHILKDWNVSDEQGKSFGVLRIYTENEPEGYEIATYRKDISKGRDTKGNNNKVEIGHHLTIEDDVKRRDLTINALFYDINKEIIVDLVDGINDINNNIIRTVGNPVERFNEDRLRILRTLRFAARTGGTINIFTKNSILKDNRLKNISNIDDVSQERIIEEIYKVIRYAETDINILNRYIKLLKEFNMFNEMFNELGYLINTKFKLKTSNDKILFFLLFKNINIDKEEQNLIKNLRIYTDVINYIKFFRRYLTDISDFMKIYKLALLRNRYNINDDILYKFVNQLNLNKKQLEIFLKYCNDGFRTDGNKLIKRGYKGKAIGIEKERLETEIFLNKYLT